MMCTKLTWSLPLIPVAICVAVLTSSAAPRVAGVSGYVRATDHPAHMRQRGPSDRRWVTAVDGKVKVFMRTALFAMSDQEQWLRFWGAADDAKAQDRWIVEKISVAHDGAMIYVPLSAYADLASPRNIHVSRTNSMIHIVVKGGDASASYTATIAFEGEAVVSRKVVDGENDKDYEVSQYFFTPLDDQ